MLKVSLLSLGFMSVLFSTFSYANECTKDEILLFIDKGFSKSEINEICNAAKKSSIENSHLTIKLITAMTLDAHTNERVGDSGEAIQAYIKNGLLGKAPNMRIDYTDYWGLKGHADFMGHTLVVIEEEYMSAYIGCCVSPGIGITVKINQDVADLKEFASINKCSLDLMDQSELNAEFESLGIKSPGKGRYATLSCRERDAMF